MFSSLISIHARQINMLPTEFRESVLELLELFTMKTIKPVSAVFIFKLNPEPTLLELCNEATIDTKICELLYPFRRQLVNLLATLSYLDTNLRVLKRYCDVAMREWKLCEKFLLMAKNESNRAANTHRNGSTRHNGPFSSSPATPVPCLEQFSAVTAESYKDLARLSADAFF